jgi:hypothetical protein
MIYDHLHRGICENLQTWHHRSISWEEAARPVCSTDSLRADRPCLKRDAGGFDSSGGGRYDPGCSSQLQSSSPMEINFDFNFVAIVKRFHLGAGRPASLQNDGKFQHPRATTGRRGCVVMVFGCLNMSLPTDAGRRRGDTSSMREGVDCPGRGPTGGGELPSGI